MSIIHINLYQCVYHCVLFVFFLSHIIYVIVYSNYTFQPERKMKIYEILSMIVNEYSHDCMYYYFTRHIYLLKN